MANENSVFTQTVEGARSALAFVVKVRWEGRNEPHTQARAPSDTATSDSSVS